MQRQGDLLLIPTPHSTERLTPLQTLVVLDGEHCHRLDGGTLLQDSSGQLFVQTRQPVQLVHDEHQPLSLAPGLYQVRRQRRYRSKASNGSAWD